jgi:hypothetical protein
MSIHVGEKKKRWELKQVEHFSDFGGAYPGLCHYITQKDYPLVHESMVSLPDLRPGDVVFT